MKYELGNLMGENPDTSALELLGYRLMAMQKELLVLQDERDEARQLAEYYARYEGDELPWLASNFLLRNPKTGRYDNHENI
jgi:hypothetical protein